jgi:hypothetical protein
MPNPLAGFWRTWKTWGLPAFVSALTPWFARLVELELISEYYQPRWGAVATLLGATGSMVAVALFIGTARKHQKLGLLRGLGLLIPAFSICLLFTFTVGHLWTFQPVALVVIRLIWVVAYLGIFVGLGWVLGVAYLLLVRK